MHSGNNGHKETSEWVLKIDSVIEAIRKADQQADALAIEQ